MPRHATLLTVSSLIALLSSGCGQRETDPATHVARFAQSLVIDFEGTRHSVPLEAMDVWLSKSPTRSEPFEIHGQGVAIVGALPPELRVGYQESWQVLVGHRVPLSARGGGPRYAKPSVLGVPGVGQFRIIGGAFTIERVDAGWNGQTPLTGRIELRVRAARGETVLNGTFTVKAMTWG